MSVKVDRDTIILVGDNGEEIRIPKTKFPPSELVTIDRRVREMEERKEVRSDEERDNEAKIECEEEKNNSTNIVVKENENEEMKMDSENSEEKLVTVGTDEHSVRKHGGKQREVRKTR